MGRGEALTRSLKAADRGDKPSLGWELGTGWAKRDGDVAGMARPNTTLAAGGAGALKALPWLGCKHGQRNMNAWMAAQSELGWKRKTNKMAELTVGLWTAGGVACAELEALRLF